MATLIACAFTASDGTELTAYTPETNIPGSSWVGEALEPSHSAPATNDAEIQSNQLKIVTSNKGCSYDVKVTDYTINYDWVIGASSGIRSAVYFRWTDKDNNYIFKHREDLDSWALVKTTAGSASTVASGSLTFNTSTTYAIEVRVSGTSLRIFVNSSELTGSPFTMDAHLTATKIGIGTNTVSQPFLVDNFNVTNTPTCVAAAGDLDPNAGTLALTLTGFPIAPTSITLNGVAATFSGSPTTTSATLQGPALSTFVLGGTHAATRWDTNIAVRCAISSFYAEDTDVQIYPTLTVNVNDFAQRSGTQYYPPTGSADGDDFYVTWASGGGSLSAAGAYFLPVTLPAQGQVRWYDVSAGSWQALYLTDYFSSAASIVEGVVMEIVRPAVKSIV